MKEMAEKCHSQSESVASTKKYLNTVEIELQLPSIQKLNNLDSENTTQSKQNYSSNTLLDDLSTFTNDKSTCESSSSYAVDKYGINHEEEVFNDDDEEDEDEEIILKDDESESSPTTGCCTTTTSGEDITPSGDESTEHSQLIHHHHHRHHNHQRRDHDSVVVGSSIYLETPIVDENICMNSVHEYENAKPKRISDDFCSSDDGGDDGPSMVSSSCETSSIAASTTAATTANIASIANIQNGDDNSIEDENFLQVSSREYLEDDTSSSCSNLMERINSNNHDESRNQHILKVASSSSSSDNLVATQHSEKSNDDEIIVSHPTTSSAESTVTFYDNDVQSMDAIERRDFEHEQRLTGGVIIKASSLVNSDNKLNLDFLKSYKENDVVNDRRSSSDSKVVPSVNEGLCTTPTSSRSSSIRLTKSAAKLNLSATLERLDQTKLKELEDKRKILPCSSRSSTNVGGTSSTIPSTSSTSSSSLLPHCPRASKFDVFLNSNSNDSLSSDKSYNTSSNHSLQNFFNKASTSSNGIFYVASEEISNKNSHSSKVTGRGEDNELPGENLVNVYSDPIPSTSSSSTSHFSKCQYQNFCCEDSAKAAAVAAINTGQKEALTILKNSTKEIISNLNAFNEKQNIPSTSTSTTTIVPLRSNRRICDYNSDRLFQRFPIKSISSLPSSSTSIRQALENDDHKFEEAATIETSSSHLPLPGGGGSSNSEQIENEFDDETWADCDEGSDEEVCTCNNNDYPGMSSLNSVTQEDDLPSRDVDLSGYIQMVSISEDMFLQDNFSPDLPTAAQRKRKLNDSRCLPDSENTFSYDPNGRKRMAFDYASTPKSSQHQHHQQQHHQNTPTTTMVSSPSTPVERRTPRSLIPTKDNPPPELQDWLLQFQRWSHAERLLAVDRLIEHCEPTQVRHMMKVIEPQFQRDFISLLPKELALQVLSYLEPKDLLRAAQTCRSWRFLCDDNLLWKEKCRQAQIVSEPKTDRPKRGRAGNMPPISSPWKAAYMRQHIIEMNWRSRPIRQPKILKGHDDHVITCLQFSGNRIVSGSDDNTLKVWSAVTGKCLRTLVGHTGGVWSSQMSGNIIISGSTDRTLKVWNMETGECIHTLLGHTSTVRCMHLHGKKVVSGSRDATLRVWDIEQGTCLHVLVGHLAAVRCVQYDGKLIVSGAYDYMVKVWHPERQECLHTLQGHTNRVYSLQFDGIHVVSGSLDTSIRVWDAETGNCKHTLMGHQSLTSGMELRQNILVSGNADSTVKVWDITTGQCLQTLSGPNKHQSAVTCLQFNSRFVITSSDDGTVKLWDVRTGEFIRNLVALESGGSGGVVWRIRANDTKLICAVGSRNGTEETKLMVLDFDVEGACLKCS